MTEISAAEWERVKNGIADLYEKDRDRLVCEGRYDTRIGILEDKRIEDARRRGNIIGASGVLIGAALAVMGWLI